MLYLDTMDDVLNTIPHLDGCPEPAKSAALSKAFHKFCKDSLAWTCDLALALKADQSDYSVAAPGYAFVHAIVENTVFQNGIKVVRGNNIPQFITEYAALNDAEGDPIIDDRGVVMAVETATQRTDTGIERGDRVRLYQLLPDHKIRVSPVPKDFPAILYFKAVLVPFYDATAFPRQILDHYLDGIINGALYFLYATPKRPWTDMNEAGVRYQMFLKDIKNAKRTEAANLAPRAISYPRVIG